jgi:hypothetical protein
MRELETKSCPIDEVPVPSTTLPVPIPAGANTFVSRRELVIERTPIEELPPQREFPAPMPGLSIPSAETSTTIVEFQITILSTLDVAADP